MQSVGSGSEKRWLSDKIRTTFSLTELTDILPKYFAVFVVGSRSVLLSVAEGENVWNFSESQKTRFVSSTKYKWLTL